MVRVVLSTTASQMGGCSVEVCGGVGSGVPWGRTTGGAKLRPMARQAA
jgi:hypothetical protein